MPEASPECTPSVSTRTVSVPATHAAQRGGEPELVVIAAAGIEADDERGIADARRQMIDIEGQIVAAGFLAGLDQDHAAGMGHALLGQRQDRRQRGEDGIAVVGAAAAVELVALAARGIQGP